MDEWLLNHIDIIVDLCFINWLCMIPWKQNWSLHLHPCCCLYTCQCSTFLLPCIVKLLSLTATRTGQHTWKGGLLHALLTFIARQKWYHNLQRSTPEVSPSPPNHEDTQIGNFKVYSRLKFGSNCSFCLKNFPKTKSEALYLAENFKHLHMHSDLIVNTHLEQDKSLGQGIAGQSLLSYW